MDLLFGISYEDDIDHARQVMLQVCEKAPEALQDPVPEVFVSAHDDSAVTLRLQVWVKSENYWALHYRLLEDVKKAFDAAGISIPYPQMDVHVPAVDSKDSSK